MDDKQIKEEIAEYWNGRGGVYDTHPGHGLKSKEEKTEWLKFLKDAMPAGAKRVLDVGAGTGFLTLLLAELGYNVKSVDLSEGMQADAKRKSIEGNLTDMIEFAIADAEKTGEPDNSFDVVVNRHLLWTLPHPSEAVDEWLRVVKPGGKVIVIDGDWKKHQRELENMSEEERAAHERKRIEWEEKMKAENKKVYSDELKDSLPLNDGKRAPIDFLEKEGRNLEIVTLDAVEAAERESLEKLGIDKEEAGHGMGRCAYIFTKSGEGEETDHSHPHTHEHTHAHEHADGTIHDHEHTHTHSHEHVHEKKDGGCCHTHTHSDDELEGHDH